MWLEMFWTEFHKEDRCCLELLKVLKELLDKWPWKLISYVIMPYHFHLILNPEDGNIRGFCGAFKSLSAKGLIQLTNDKRFVLNKPNRDGSIHQVWRESFKAFPLWSAWMIWQKINYIHNNPIRAKLVQSAKDYRWSSFRAFYLDSEEPLRVDHNWWWLDDVEAIGRNGYYRKVKDEEWGLPSRFE